MLICIALVLFNTLANINIPCSVNAKGGILSPIVAKLEVPNWHLQFRN